MGAINHRRNLICACGRVRMRSHALNAKAWEFIAGSAEEFPDPLMIVTQRSMPIILYVVDILIDYLQNLIIS